MSELGSINDFQKLLEKPMSDQLIAFRRLLHRHAEPGWCEIHTAARVVEALSSLGWDVRLGADVIDPVARLGVPSDSVIDSYYSAALAAGADSDVVEKMKGGMTGVVATLRGGKPGPTVAFRFDMDANLGTEASDPGHAPVREGFTSVHIGVHHNCGHDGHTSMGVALARELAHIRDQIAGEIRLIFQPAEEGLRGAKAMVAAGVLDGVDYFVGCHIGVQSLHVGEIIAGYDDILGSVKLDVDFEGRAAHAAISPHVGCNALLAACTATVGLMAITRHGDGDTRVNVGIISGGESRNTIPANAKISVELRADKGEVLDFLRSRAESVLEGAAKANEVAYTVQVLGKSCAASSDKALSDIVASVAAGIPEVNKIRGHVAFRGSDDAAEMMDAVQKTDGKAVYFGLGAELSAVHHNPRFDFNEDALAIGVNMLVGIAKKLCVSS